VWGAGGFVVFGAAPGLGLPPELPGMHAAPLHHRQGWWVMTALATFCGLALMTTGRTLGISEPRFLLSRAGGLALMVLPQLIGPPDYMHTMGAGDRPPPGKHGRSDVTPLFA
jgi:predicted cobalt transporter CbtA